MPKLTLVPPREPTPAEKLLNAVKSIPPPAGVLQCAKCGGRTVMTTVEASRIDEKGHYKRGTVCDDRVCYHCHMRKIWSPMVPDKPRIVKESKPRHTKPKAVK